MRKLKISRIIILILVPILIVSGGVCVAYMLFTQKESVIEEKSYYDLDLFSMENGGRIDNLTQEQRTNLALRFCGKIKKAGYDPMIYGNMTWLYQNYDFEKISKYPIWLASYSSDCPMEDKFEMWQYSNIGQVNGIEGDVDINIYLQKK